MHNALHPVFGELDLSTIDPKDTGDIRKEDDIEEELQKHQKALYDLHYKMYAENRRALLIVLHGIDASGKDGAVRYLAGGLNPQGFKIHSFKVPSELEVDHDYLWRVHNVCPGRGEVAIFNRSHYEEVAVVKVHPQILEKQWLPKEILKQDNIFKQRYRQIRDFERILHENGTIVLKFLFHISRDEQQKRFEKRMSDPKKHWKFSSHDLEERKHWDSYMKVFAEMVTATSVDHAPWYVIPADRKWYRNYALGKIIARHLGDLDMKFPDMPAIDD